MNVKRGVFIILFLSFTFVNVTIISAFSGSGTGTWADPYQITNCTQLQEMNNSVFANYSLMNNINCSDTINWNSGAGFIPVGNSTTAYNFRGSLNGKGYTISNLFINKTTAGTGLFSYGLNATIFNLSLYNSTIIGTNIVGAIMGKGIGVIINFTSSYGNITSNGSYVGGLVGDLEGSTSGITPTINNSYSSGQVKGNSSYVGGMIGYVAQYPQASLNYLSSNATVSGGTYVGGLIGFVSYNSGSCTIAYSNASGNVDGVSGYVGGLIGYGAYFSIRYCKAYGNVNGTGNSFGGLIGRLNSGGAVYYSGAYGNVTTSGDYVGGLVGNTDSSILYSFAKGTVTSTGAGSVGGFVGYTSNAGAVDSYSLGNVSGNSRVGGFVGGAYNAGIYRCYSKGYVNYSSGYGFQGYSGGAELIQYSYWDINSSGKTSSLGGTGKTTSQMKNVSTYTNVSSSSVWDFAGNPFNDTGNSNFWNINSSYNEGYPYLTWEYGEDLFGPTITQNSPPDNYSANLPASVNFNCSASDNAGLVNISLYITNSSNQNLMMNKTTAVSGTSNITNWTLTLGEGTYSWQCYSTDSLLNLGNGSLKKIYIDSIPPTISIIYPANNTNSTNIGLDILYNVSDSSLISSCWYSNDTYSVNTTLASCANISSVTWSQGRHNATVWVNDSAGNINKASLSFFIDSIAPNLTIVTPANNTNTTNSMLNVNYTVVDSGIGINTCWYSNDTYSINTTLPNCANITSLTWNDGQHNVSIWVNDSVGNTNKSTIRFNVDSTPPSFNNISNQTLSIWNALAYSINATDARNNVSCFEVNDTSNFKINCSGYLQNNTQLTIKLYWINITVNDTYGNRNSAYIFVNVSETESPNITLNSPGLEYVNSTAPPISILFNCSVTDNYNLKNLSLYLTESTNSSFLLNQTTNVSGVSNSSSWTLNLSNGNYTWSCLTYDYAENYIWGENRSIIISYTPVPDSSENSTNQISRSGYTAPVFYPPISSIETGYEKEMHPEWKIQIKTKEENHILTVNYIQNKTVTVTISSTPQTKTMVEGEEWKVELTGDKIYDLLVKVNSIKTNNANIFIKEINESIFSESKEVITEKNQTEEIKNGEKYLFNLEKNLNYIIPAAIIIILAIILLILKKKSTLFPRRH